MKTGLRGVNARIASSADEASGRKPPPLRAFAIAGAIVVAVAFVLLVARHAVIGLLLTRGLGVVTGDRIAIGEFAIGSKRAVFTTIRVATPDGRPLLDARRMALTYSLGDLWSGHGRRWGLIAISVDAPIVSLVRHADGSYNVASNAGGGAASGPETPWRVVVHIEHGEVRLIDEAPVAGDLAEQRLIDVQLDAQIDTRERSRATGKAAFLERASAVSQLGRYPINGAATVDYRRGLALTRITAALLPVRGPIAFLQHSSAVRVDAGLLHHVVVTLYGLGITPGSRIDMHVGGVGDFSDGRVRIGALARPVRNLRGRISLVDDGLWTTRLAGNLGGMKLVARGGAYDRWHPTLRLGLFADGDLHDLRSVFGFSRTAPVTGGVHVETLLEAPVTNLLIRSALGVDRGAYGNVPLSNITGRVDYHAGAVLIDGIRGRYGSATIGVGARFLLGGGAPNSVIVATATAPGRTLPFAENLAPDASVTAVTLIAGSAAGYRARGALDLEGGPTTGAGTFSVDEHGVGEFGPFAFARPDGSSLIGALRLERPTSQSAAWISARAYRTAVPAVASRLPGVNVPAFPPVAGVIDGELAGGGTPGAFALIGDLRGRDLRVGNARLGTGRVRLGGSLADVRLETLAIDGPLGRFSGSGAAARGSFALRGYYDGSLERLVPLTGKQEAGGAVRGDVLATLAGSNVVVQSPDALLNGGSVRGVALESAAGTIAVCDKTFELIAGTGSIMGRRAVAAESGGTIAVSAPEIPSAALRGTGLPLDAGNVSAYGVADLRSGAVRFHGTVAVEGGRTRGFAVGGDAQIDLVGPRARISAATGALGSTYGAIDGSITGIGEHALAYDLDARVPLGDLDLLRRDLGLPVRHLAGTFSANLHVGGSGTRPFADGRFAVPEGVYNGLAFSIGGAALILDPFGAAARAGTLSVGSTRTLIDASAGNGAFGVAARSTAANVSDFNDFFDRDDTLAGRGSFALAVRTYGRRIVTSGALAMQGLRYRAFPVGNIRAAWGMRGPAISGRARASGPAGTVIAAGTIVPAAGTDMIRAFSGARYDGLATFGHVDLGTWLPAAGFATPLLGTVDARIRLAGRAPSLAVGADVALTNGTIGGVAVRTAHLRATSRGSRITVAESDADVGFANLAANGRLGVARADPLAFDVRVTSRDVGAAVRALIPAAREVAVAGTLAADVRVRGTRASPIVEGGFDVENAQYAGFTLPRAIGSLALSGSAIELRDADVELPIGQAFVAGSLPLVLRPFGLGPARAPVSVDVTARGVELAQFAPLFPRGTSLGGTVDGRFGVEGSVDRPHLFGALNVTGGSFASPLERAPIKAVDASIVFSGSSVALEAFHADVGRGTLDGSGRITLPFGNLAGPAYRADLVAKAADFDFPAYGRGTVDANLELTGGTAAPLVTGDVRLRNAVIPVSAVYGGSSGGAASGGPGLLVNPRFDVHAVAADNVRIRSAIVDIGVSGAVDLSGTLATPRLAGNFTATDGTISSYNHVFRIVNAAVSFSPADGVIPTIEARAISRVTNPDPDPSRNVAGSANIIVTVSGTADANNLAVTYSSDPAYSQEQIIGLLLDVPALLGAVNFNLNGGPGSPVLRGAPGETNVLLPPGVTPEQVSAISFNQEVFSLLNGQFTQRALTPIERVFEKTLGLSDIEFTVDYGGGLGYSLRRQIGKRDFYAFLSQTVTYPERANIGFELQPKPYESVNFSFYQQNGVTSLITNQTPGEEFLSSTHRLTSVQPLGNRSGLSLNFNRRF